MITIIQGILNEKYHRSCYTSCFHVPLFPNSSVHIKSLGADFCAVLSCFLWSLTFFYVNTLPHWAFWQVSSRECMQFFKMHNFSPGWCGSTNWAQACEPKGRWFHSQSGHMPGLWARCPVGGVCEATTHWCFCPSLLLPFFPSQKK